MHAPSRRLDIMVRVLTLAALVIAGLDARLAAGAGGQLSFADWLARQSTRLKDFDGDGLCGEPYDDQYIPANRSFIFWTAPAQGRSAVVDYLGVSGSYLASSCGVDLGTTVAGTVTAHDTRDGRVLVSVRGHASNALAYAADGFPLDTLIFGAREAEVCAGAAASVVDVEYAFQYYADPAEPIIDMQWFGNPPPSVPCETADDPFEFRLISLRAQGDGTRPDGSRARLTVSQTGTLQSHSHSSNYDGFPVEFINVKPIGP